MEILLDERFQNSVLVIPMIFSGKIIVAPATIERFGMKWRMKFDSIIEIFFNELLILVGDKFYCIQYVYMALAFELRVSTKKCPTCDVLWETHA